MKWIDTNKLSQNPHNISYIALEAHQFPIFSIVINGVELQRAIIDEDSTFKNMLTT